MSKVTETRQQKGIYVRKTLGLAVLGAAMTLAAGNAAAADGSFTGEAQGMGPVSVGITVANGRVSAVQVNVANETPGYGRDIGATMEKRILEAQSADVDGVSGASITSAAVKAAAQAAFAKAGLVAAAAKSPVLAGTYVGSAQGAKSRVHATVKVDEKGRFTIEKITSGDTPYVSDSAFAFVEKNIEDGQTLAVDALTGATLSSRGLVGAVSDALRQAGVDTASLLVKQSAPVKVSREEETADVVVIGGGAAGMAAALAAKTTDRLEAGKPNGLKVVLLETKGYLGGDLAICGGYVAAYSGTPLNERTGLTMTGKEVVAATKAAKTPEVAAMVNDELAVRAVDEVGPLLNSLVAQGFRIVPEDATRGATNSPYFQDGILHYTVARTSDMRDGYRSQDKGYDTTSGSPWMAEGLSDLVKKAGVDVRLMTSATDLVRGANGIETVSVADGRSTYRIRAKAVVLATGYSGLDAESVKLFYPNLEGVIRTGGAGVTSFAPKWVLKEGGKVAMNPGSSTMLGYDSVLGIDGAESEIYQKLFMPWVNLDGKRFMSEGGHGPNWGLKAGADMPEIENVPATGRSVAALMKQPEKRAWMIFDSTHEAVKHYEHLAGSGLAKRADTLEGLAEAAGIRDVKAFEETIAQYNADFEKGGDTFFAVPKNEMRPVLKAPFYAVRIAAVNTIANTTAYADDDTTILMGPNGPRVEGLFGAGGAIGNCITNTGLGAHNATALSSGAIAGAAARAYAEKR